jgi:hypothetical protein
VWSNRIFLRSRFFIYTSIQNRVVIGVQTNLCWRFLCVCTVFFSYKDTPPAFFCYEIKEGGGCSLSSSENFYFSHPHKCRARAELFLFLLSRKWQGDKWAPSFFQKKKHLSTFSGVISVWSDLYHIPVVVARTLRAIRQKLEPIVTNLEH